jgi:hypothetical protein
MQTYTYSQRYNATTVSSVRICSKLLVSAVQGRFTRPRASGHTSAVIRQRSYVSPQERTETDAACQYLNRKGSRYAERYPQTPEQMYRRITLALTQMYNHSEQGIAARTQTHTIVNKSIRRLPLE